MPKKTTTIRVLKPVLKSRVEVERIVNETVAAQIERESLVALRDEKLRAITEKHGPAIDSLGTTLETNLTLLEQWAEASPAEFGDQRSLIIHGHRLGFRLGNPTVAARGKLTFKAIVKMIAEKGGDLAAKFLRVKTDLDKEAVLSTGRLLESTDEAVRETAAIELDELGCEIVQTQTFYLEPNREGQADTTLAKAS